MEEIIMAAIAIFPKGGCNSNRVADRAFNVIVVFIYKNSSYVAANRARARRCLATSMRVRIICISPSVSPMSGQSAAMETRSSLY